ncbi:MULTISPECIES: ABC transporter ATP-binding protein [Glycomyces]|uniref:ABC transporter ATP-binding protein n=2 Tax=Glycomyces TaxID=58113 RepID=A0A9X3PK42_9ACTN|nr:ABC transporter ATP-binding protein [Glycomyces lechevalierae]MDA1385098.1 ABC transporter ATP-binding protein [Glycomyces lechevalierae]MDR7337288.1 ABC-2 type transport system ATP-binding protein [Glycomyces lechevalierae]
MAIIEVRDLVKDYGSMRAVDGISFEVEEGEIFGILGPNGAGKTTTVECIEGLRSRDGGSVRVMGLDPERDGPELKQVLGIQLQESRLPDRIRVGEALDLYASFYRSPANTDRLIEKLGLERKRKTPFGKLSGGQQQRLSIALALVGNPRVAVLDELTTGLDPQARRDTWDLIEQVRNSGVTIILVTHFMDEAERLCDRIAVVDTGKIVALDTPAGLTARVSEEQRVRFRPSAAFADALLLDLPEVARVERSGPHVVVTGDGNVLQAVASVLARNQIVAAELRVEQVSLDDAFVALTGKSLEH